MKRPRSDDVPGWEEILRLCGADDDTIVAGIDEAGRGPTVGPMIYAAALIRVGDHDALVRCGVDDSKALTPAARAASLAKCRTLLPRFDTMTREIGAETISSTMLGPTGRTLNTLAWEAIVSLISDATLAARGRLAAVIVDTVGPPAALARHLRGRFAHLRIVVAPHADATFAVVAAASMVAKEAREAAMDPKRAEVGSGYPRDAAPFLAAHTHRVWGYPTSMTWIRHAWAPVKRAVEAMAVPWEFEEDRDRGAGTLRWGRTPGRGKALAHGLGLAEAASWTRVGASVKGASS